MRETRGYNPPPENIKRPTPTPAPPQKFAGFVPVKMIGIIYVEELGRYYGFSWNTED